MPPPPPSAVVDNRLSPKPGQSTRPRKQAPRTATIDLSRVERPSATGRSSSAPVRSRPQKKQSGTQTGTAERRVSPQVPHHVSDRIHEKRQRAMDQNRTMTVDESVGTVDDSMVSFASESGASRASDACVQVGVCAGSSKSRPSSNSGNQFRRRKYTTSSPSRSKKSPLPRGMPVYTRDDVVKSEDSDL